MPTEVSRVPLRGLAALVSDKVTSRKDAHRPYVGLEDMTSGSADLAGFSPSEISISTNSVFEKGDVLFGKLRPNLRKSVIAPFSGYCSTDILVLRPRPGADPSYVGHLFRSENLAAAAVRTAIGTKMPRTSWADLEDVRVFAPQIGEQRIIAEILDTADDALRRTQKLIAKLQLIKHGLLHDLLTCGIDERGELRNLEQHREQFKESPLGRMPRSWSVRPIREISDSYAGGTPSRAVSRYFAGDIPWVKSAEVNAEEITSTEENLSAAGLETSSARWIEPGTPVVAMYGATAGAVSWLTIRATTNQAVLALPPRLDTVEARWFYWSLLYSAPRLVRNVQGSGQDNLSKAVIDRMLMMVPDTRAERQRISGVLDGLVTRLGLERRSYDKLLLLRRGLVDDLLTGRVRVSKLLDGSAA